MNFLKGIVFMGEKNPVVIDMHHHLLNVPHYDKQLIDTMDRLKIDYACVSGLGLPSANWLGDLSPTNDDVLRSMDRYQDRIIGFGNIRLGVDKVQKVEELYSQGFTGIKTTRALKNYDDEEFDEIYARAEALGLPILFHTGFILKTFNDKQDNVSAARMRPEMLDRVARTFPDLVIIIAHLGMPWHEEAAQMTRFHENVYVDLSGSPNGWRNRKAPHFFNELFYWEEAYEKVVFGSDVHFNDVEDSLNDYKRILTLNNIPLKTQQNIFGETMRKILKL
ncbi:amidohydrolase family protein [Paenisporosarcina sp. TG-14]|uniref:amidohydrolase family protein n=1 Tax=Paenisporosarcina sp. TG-14 TaxID=1231057 RepID=UPI0009DA8876|nr:amidohydrolase family protein [Paenisporosarcina sp. TG-14]